MPFRKLTGPDKWRRPCLDPEHEVPGHIVLEPGVWEWTCPACGAKRVIVVPLVTASAPVQEG